MAEQRAELGGFGAGTAGTEAAIQPSLWNALPYFISLAIFPLVANAAIHGGWWIAGPFIFLWVVEGLDAVFSMEERNMDPKKTLERQLFWYKLAIWLWAGSGRSRSYSRSGRSLSSAICLPGKPCSWRRRWPPWPRLPSLSATN